MGWGCYRHEIDAESDNWKAKITALIPDGRSYGKPFDWGRDGQVCPFCWVELEQITNIYQKALGQIQDHPEQAETIALHAFEDAEKIELHPLDTDSPKKKSRYGWSADPQTDAELQAKYGDSVHRPKES